MAKLTPKQQTFVEEYLCSLNATQSAIKAGYSKKTANEQGSRLLANVKIQKEIQKAMDKRSKRTEITADKVLQELAHMAFDKMDNYLDFRTEKQVFDYDEDGKPVFGYSQIVEMKDSNEIDTRNVSEVSYSPKDGFKFKLYDKQKALVDLGKHLKLFTDKVEHSGTITNQNMDLSYMSDEELEKALKKYE